MQQTFTICTSVPHNPAYSTFIRTSSLSSSRVGLGIFFLRIKSFSLGWNCKANILDDIMNFQSKLEKKIQVFKKSIVIWYLIIHIQRVHCTYLTNTVSGYHTKQFQGLCSTKSSRKMLQNLSYFWNKRKPK